MDTNDLKDSQERSSNKEMKFCPNCGVEIKKPTIRCLKCGEPFADFNIAPVNNFQLKHIEEKGLSFDYPDYYLLAKIPDNNPDCVVALAKDDGLCDIMVEVSSAPDRIIYQEGIFEKKYEEYINGLGFYNMEVINGFGLNKLCFQAYTHRDVGVIKSTIYFDLNQSKDLRIILNTLEQYDYDCMDDLKVIAKNLSYKNKNKNNVKYIFAIAIILLFVALFFIWLAIIPSIALFIYGYYLYKGN